MIVAQPNIEGNFAFLISDDVNAINDFESVNVYILKIILLRSGDTNQPIEFEPEKIKDPHVPVLPERTHLGRPGHRPPQNIRAMQRRGRVTPCNRGPHKQQ